MRLQDEDVSLRPFTDEDVPAITAACQDPEISRWTLVPSPYTEEHARAYIRSAENKLAIVDRETDALLGSIGWRDVDGNVQVGYWVASEARGSGVATAALRLLSRWALAELGVGRVQLLTEPENVASQRVAEKAGFRREATLRKYLDFKGRRRDAVMFALLEEDLR